MARRRGRKYRRYLRGIIDAEISLGTLGPNAVVANNEANVLTESAFLTSVKATWSLIDFTAGTQDGPIVVGLAHSDYSDGEIEQWIENTLSWDQGDMIGQEINKRKIRRVGVFQNLSTVTAGADALNDGRPITTKCKWGLNTGDTVRFWAYNTGTGTLTTGALVKINGFANLWPN